MRFICIDEFITEYFPGKKKPDRRAILHSIRVGKFPFETQRFGDTIYIDLDNIKGNSRPKKINPLLERILNHGRTTEKAGE